MPQQVNFEVPRVRLSKATGIGFTGHRRLKDEAKCRAFIRGFLADRKSKNPGMLFGVSSAAAGADLLFAECCIELDIPLRILLPSSRQDFKGDFEPHDWARAEAVFTKAASIEEISDGALRNEKYYECGIRTVQDSQLLLALWDGAPARGLGGTEQIVAFARKIGRLTIWLNSDTGVTQVFNQNSIDALLHDPELEFLNSLPDTEIFTASGSYSELAKAWLRKLDDTATRFAPHVRRLAVLPILCTGVAAFLTGAALYLPQPQLWLTAGTLFGLAAIGLPFILRLPQKRSRWERTRAAAEACRSILALWRAPLMRNLIEPEMLPELGGMIGTLDLMRALDMRNQSIALEEFKVDYRVNRVIDQADFFQRQTKKAARLAKKTRAISLTCIALAFCLGAFDFIVRVIFHSTHNPAGHGVISMAMSALFQISTVALAFAMIKDADRRRSRYSELSELLRKWDNELELLMTWSSVLQVVSKIERSLLVELLEWRSLMRHSTIARK